MKKLVLLLGFACLAFAGEAQLKLYVKDSCPYCHKVLEQLEHSVPTTDIGKSTAARDELAQKGGKTQVPCLFIDDQPLYESDAIIEWLKAHGY